MGTTYMIATIPASELQSLSRFDETEKNSKDLVLSLKYSLAWSDRTGNDARHILAISPFAGRELILSAYRHAVEAGYRFYSYGDCMWVR
jgi:hypothetical protein